MEYSCQYSDQVRKKHKTWHDGELKFTKSSKRLALYSVEEKKKLLLSSTMITNSRDLERILDPGRFNVEEHRVFGRYVVIVNGTASKPSVEPQRTGGSDPLALSMKPFKKPRTVANRPSLRHRVVKQREEPADKGRRIRRVCHQPIML